MEMALYLVIGVKGGQWLDGHWGTDPLMERIGVGFGFFAGFYLLWKLTRQHGDSSRKGEKTLAPGQESKDSDTTTTDDPKTPPRP